MAIAPTLQERTVMRKVVVKDGKSFVRLKMLPVANARRLARLMGAKPTPTKSKRVWMWMEVTSERASKKQNDHGRRSANQSAYR